VPVTLEQSAAVCVVRVEGGIDITRAAEFKELLLQALASGKNLRLNLERGAELDITALQLLWVAEREARISGKGFSLAKPVPEAIAAPAREAGFEKFPVPVDASQSTA
jgi:anti-anti-sigma regulatory factor